MKASAFLLSFALVLSSPCLTLAADDAYDQSIQKFLNDNFANKDTCMVVAQIDEHGTKVFSAGKLGNGSDKQADADTVFEIGSCTKTFTALLLLDMVQRGQMKLEDPVAMYLPDSVKLPTHNGKQITLVNLAAQESGLPHDCDNFHGKTSAENFATYTVDDMYDYLGRYKLTQDPGEAFRYSNIGMGLLGHVLAKKANTTFESLLVDRICQPLHMDSTRITLSPEQKSRFAQGHDEKGKPTANFELPAIAGAGAIRSTANDLLKYVAAHLAITPSPLTPLMEKTHEFRHLSPDINFGNTGMPWYDQSAMNAPGSQIIGHGGGTGGYVSFIGFDLKQHRGIVVLSNQTTIHSSQVGGRILQHAPLLGRDPSALLLVREIVGLGLQLDIDKPTHALKIRAVTPNSPASVAELSGFFIESIDGIDTQDKDLLTCVKLLKGAEGTAVKLALLDPDRKQSKTVELTRKKIIIDQ
jgi:D-alanyl-D-alanine-carboxypeptidase/D-alanyl-D-alanine-endopeptidase